MKIPGFVIYSSFCASSVYGAYAYALAGFAQSGILGAISGAFAGLFIGPIYLFSAFILAAITIKIAPSLIKAAANLVKPLIKGITNLAKPLVKSVITLVKHFQIFGKGILRLTNKIAKIAGKGILMLGKYFLKLGMVLAKIVTICVKTFATIALMPIKFFSNSDYVDDINIGTNGERQNLIDFKNEVSVIGQGMRDENGFFGKLPVEISHKIVSALAKTHGFFAPSLTENIERNLYPACKHEIQSDKASEAVESSSPVIR